MASHNPTITAPTSHGTPPPKAAPTEVDIRAISTEAGSEGGIWIAEAETADGGILWTEYYFRRKKNFE
jgi:hypothetical protein